MNGHINGAINGTKRSPAEWDWHAVRPVVTPALADSAHSNAIAEAEAEAIRARTVSETEAARIRAQADADAIRAKAVEEARKQRIANDKAEKRAEEEDAARKARIAESNRKRVEAERAHEDEAEQLEAAKAAELAAAQEVAAADGKWRAYAIRFAIVCGIVSLPVQMSFFWNPKAPWMAAAPVMLEGAAWVVHRGAHAAAVSKRPVWHYRVIVWLLALVAAGINLYHGLHSFDPGTALATAFASVAGPGVWDLHENGRLRRREGVLTRRERKAQEKAEKVAAAEKQRRETQQRADRQAAESAAQEAAAKLATEREERFPVVWGHALDLAAALGETTVTEAVWKRAHRDIEGADPGESVDVIRGRNAAARRLSAAVSEAPGSRPVRASASQVDQQMPRSGRRGHAGGPPVRGVRTPGDTARYSTAARRAASITAKNAAQKDA